SSVRPTGSPPIPIHTRARARRPAGPPAPAPPPSTALLLPWLQFLKGWSLRQTRGDSVTRPAHVVNLRWNVIAWNAAADRLFGYSAWAGGERNFLRAVFADLDLRRRLPAWGEDAP